jgi:hypothetical protein
LMRAGRGGASGAGGLGAHGPLKPRLPPPRTPGCALGDRNQSTPGPRLHMCACTHTHTHTHTNTHTHTPSQPPPRSSWTTPSCTPTAAARPRLPPRPRSARLTRSSCGSWCPRCVRGRTGARARSHTRVRAARAPATSVERGGKRECARQGFRLPPRHPTGRQELVAVRPSVLTLTTTP